MQRALLLGSLNALVDQLQRLVRKTTILKEMADPTGINLNQNWDNVFAEPEDWEAQLKSQTEHFLQKDGPACLTFFQ